MARGFDGRDGGDQRGARGVGRSHRVGRGKVGTGAKAHEWAQLLALALDDLDEPLRIDLPAVPHPASARLLAALGVQWTVRKVTVAASSTSSWIDYRASLRRVDDRRDRGETVEACGFCGCELDVTPVAHSPRCKTLSTAKETTVSTGLEALERMDAGEPQEPLREGEPNGEDAGLPTSSSERARDRAATAESVPAGSSPSRNGRKPGPKSKYTRKYLIAEIKAYGAEHGHAPTGTVASRLSNGARHAGLVWADLVEEAGFERPSRGKLARPVGAATPARPTSPAKPPGGAPKKPSTAVAKVETPAAATVESIREPRPNADIPYDADRLEDEADYLRKRADALLEIASGIRRLAEL